MYVCTHTGDYKSNTSLYFHRKYNFIVSTIALLDKIRVSAAKHYFPHDHHTWLCIFDAPFISRINSCAGPPGMMLVST